MNDHPVVQIIRSFTAAEHKTFAKEVARGTRSSDLYHLLKTGKPEVMDKQVVFRKIFRENYSREKDYLLRNELSILRLRLQAFILQNLPDDDVLPQKRWEYYQLSEWLYQRNLYALARESLDKSLKLAQRYEDWELLVKLNRLELILEQLSIDGLAERIQALKESIYDHELYIRKLFTRESRYVSYLYGLLIKLQKMKGTAISSFPEITGTHFSFSTFETPMSAFLYEKGKAFATGGTASVPFLEQALAHLEKASPTPETQTQWFICAGQIASEHSAAGNFAMAEKWFAQILMTPGLEHYSGRNFLLMNYLTTLVKLRKWHEVLAQADALEKSATEEYVQNRLSAAKVSCYIFLRDTTQLKKYLPKDFSVLDTDVRHYYRMQYSIYFYLSGQTEEAEREMQNLSGNKLAENRNYQPLISLLLHFYQCMTACGNQRPDRKWATRMEKIFREFEAMALPEVKAMVPAIWVTEEWEKIKK